MANGRPAGVECGLPAWEGAAVARSDARLSRTTDRIFDFSSADGDHITLSGIDANASLAGDQAFAIIGTEAFGNTAGQLRYEVISGNTFPQADLNGDSIADLWLRLDGTVTLSASDFWL